MSNYICVSYADLISTSPATDISNVAFESVALSPAQVHDYAASCYATSKRNGFWAEDWPITRNTAMMTCEMAEVLEVFRKCSDRVKAGVDVPRDTLIAFMEESGLFLRHGEPADELSEDAADQWYKEAYAKIVKGYPQEEIIDVAIYLLDAVGHNNWDVLFAYVEDDVNHFLTQAFIERCNPFFNPVSSEYMFRNAHPTEIACAFYALLFAFKGPVDCHAGLLLRFLEKWMFSMGWDFQWHLRAKMLYNNLRSPMHGGKKF